MFTKSAIILVLALGLVDTIDATSGDWVLPPGIMPFNKYSPYDYVQRNYTLKFIMEFREIWADWQWAELVDNLAHIGITTVDGVSIKEARKVNDPNSHYICRGQDTKMADCYGPFYLDMDQLKMYLVAAGFFCLVILLSILLQITSSVVKFCGVPNWLAHRVYRNIALKALGRRSSQMNPIYV